MGAGTFRVGEGPPAGLPADPLQGKWWIIEGREVKDEGYYFEGGVGAACGSARFLDFPQRQVNFEPNRAPGPKTVPWGIFGYEMDPSGILVLSRPDGSKIRCFLKFKNEHLLSLEDEPPQPRPVVCVFYDPEGRHAFKIFRMSEEIGRLAAPGESLSGEKVFVPFEDVLTGSWAVLPGQAGGGGSLDYRLDAPAPADAARLTVRADNSADLKMGEASVRFRLRQSDPTHWAIVSPPDVRCATGTIAIEQAAQKIIGPSVLLTRWRIGERTLTAVLQAEGSRRAPNVPMVRFEAAAPLTLEALRLTNRTSQTSPTRPTGPTSPTGPTK